MRGNDFPALFSEPYPGLALPPNQISPRHFELQIHRREITAKRQDLQP